MDIEKEKKTLKIQKVGIGCLAGLSLFAMAFALFDPILPHTAIMGLILSLIPLTLVMGFVVCTFMAPIFVAGVDFCTKEK